MQTNSVFKSVQMTGEIDRQLDIAIAKTGISFNAFVRSAIINECLELEKIGADEWIRTRKEKKEKEDE